MSIKLFSDIALTLTVLPIFPKTYNIYVVSPEEALKIVEDGRKKQPHDETRICTTTDRPIADIPLEQ
ncbi:MAG: hypothetical protein LBC20_03015 [Planctomycetaceae bacterium]|nr:hypothetical protein [Planctomycetaceae bacterium]